MRTIIIGDVHGHSGSLNALLDRIGPESGRDRLVFLGDLFDRGPDSFGVLQRVMKLADAFGDRFILLLGNHEDYLLQPTLTRRQRAIWEQVGSHEIVLMNRYTGPLTITGHIALKRATWFAGDGETSEELEENVRFPMPQTGVICIDTGCGKGGKLTAMVTEGQQYYLQSVPEQ